jgi:hypothetical protein
MHVATGLDAFMLDLVELKTSVVLTGNAGDGKTHALKRVAPALRKSGAVVIEDATALMRRDDPTPVLEKWHEAVDAQKPFCIAINEYPLYQLRKALPDFAPLQETWRQSRNRLAYGSEREDTRTDLLVIDLSLRNPLAPEFALRVLDGILNDAGFLDHVAADPDSVAAANAERLRDAQVRRRLEQTLSRAVALGARATVREVWILFARMVMGRSTSHDFSRADWYFEPLSACPSLHGSDALRRTVDPARCSHPRWDALLEAGLSDLQSGWRLSRPPVPPQPRLDPAVFAWLKRAFYFEHEEGEKSLELTDPEANEFRDLLAGAGQGSRSVTEMVDAINAAYCPARFSGRKDYLYLWSGHRFHEQPSRSFVATDRIPVDALELRVPRLPSPLARAFEFHADHLMLVAPRHGDARLRIDYPLFRTLKRLGRGLPRKLIPEREVHRLDAFLEKLGAERDPSRGTIWSVHLEHLEVLEFGLSNDLARYETAQVSA